MYAVSVRSVSPVIAGLTTLSFLSPQTKAEVHKVRLSLPPSRLLLMTLLTWLFMSLYISQEAAKQ